MRTGYWRSGCPPRPLNFLEIFAVAVRLPTESPSRPLRQSTEHGHGPILPNGFIPRPAQP